MHFSQIFGYVFYGLVALLIFGLFRVEINAWQRDRKDPSLKKHASQRLFRRVLGACLLTLALILLKYPPTESFSLLMQVFKMLMCLFLCIGAMAVTIWDFRIMRREMRKETQSFVEDSAQDLRRHLQEVAQKKRPR